MHDELELVRRAQSGDPEAFGGLVQRHWSRLVRFARSMVGDEAAEDAVQESLLLCWRKLPGLARPESFGAWINRILFRRCLRLRRRQWVQEVALERVPATPAGNPHDAAWVSELLSALAPRQRAVMHLTVVEGHTDTETAGLLGIATSSVRAHRRRARRRLDALIGGGADGRRS
jgi:RNA polymerase sigma-70 factor (ECF subfamily)